MAAPVNILVVCMGNICRSPMAEGLLRTKLPHTQVSSAGLNAVVGDPAQPHAVDAMKELGIDISAHKARQITPELVAAAELVLVMSSGQKNELEARYSWARGRVFRIGEWDRFDIDDPMGASPATFLRVRQLLEQTCNTWITRL